MTAAAATAIIVTLALLDISGGSPTATTERGNLHAPAPKPRVFVSTTGSDTNPCTMAAPCASFNRGYQAARSGDVVEIAAGEYGPQRLEFDARKTGLEHVVLRQASGAVVRAPLLEFGKPALGVKSPTRVTVSGLAIDYVLILEGSNAADIVLRGIDGKTFDIFGGNRIRVLGGDYWAVHRPGGSTLSVRVAYRRRRP